MKIDRLGAWLVGSVLLGVGFATLITDLDPLALCFKQCDLPKALASLLGPKLLKILIGGFFVAMGALFLMPLVIGGKRNKTAD
jgi:hypothetical protein